MFVSNPTRAMVANATIFAAFALTFVGEAGAQSLETQADADRACQAAVQDKARSMWGITRDIAFQEPSVSYEKTQFIFDGSGRFANAAGQDGFSYQCVYDADRSKVEGVTLKRSEASDTQ